MLARRWSHFQWLVLAVLPLVAEHAFAQAESLGPMSANISGFGQPLPAVAAHPSDLSIFLAGQRLFSTAQHSNSGSVV